MGAACTVFTVYGGEACFCELKIVQRQLVFAYSTHVHELFADAFHICIPTHMYSTYTFTHTVHCIQGVPQ